MRLEIMKSFKSQQIDRRALLGGQWVEGYGKLIYDMYILPEG